MSSDLGTLTLYVGSTAGINAVSKISKGADPVPGLIASGLLFGLFAVVGSMWRFDIVKAVAGVMLLAAILINGVPFFQSLGAVANGLATGTATVIPKGKREPAGQVNVTEGGGGQGR